LDNFVKVYISPLRVSLEECTTTGILAYTAFSGLLKSSNLSDERGRKMNYVRISQKGHRS